MRVENCYISCNCNPIPSVTHWGRNDLVCYGSCNSIMIYDPNLGSGGKVTHTLVGHSKRVNSVKWLCGKDVTFETEVMSVSTDSSVRVWTYINGSYESQVLESHNLNVNIVDGLYNGNDKYDAVVVSVSMDNTVIIWHRHIPTDKFVLSQTINFGYNICVGIKISYLPNTTNLILACALDNSKIQIYVESESPDNKIIFESSVQLIGHEDWVRGLDFTVDGQDLLLASCSQDTFIRLWRLTQKSLIKDSVNNYDNNEKLQIKLKNKIFNIYLESILAGHEGWVYSVDWSPNALQLLSASIDKSMVIWEHDEMSGLWLEKIRVGEVGGNTLGFYGGIFGPNGLKILAHSYHGAFHIWTCCEKLHSWEPSVTVGGHFSEVVDCAWEPGGQFLYSLSADQTTRVHVPWPNNKEPVTWHELARPQIHGYDMSSIAVLSRYRFASSAEEKVIRVFEAPQNFVENFSRICLIEEDLEGNGVNTEHLGPKGASVPSLGLSNKAIYTDFNVAQALSGDKRNPYPEEYHFTATYMLEPPTEETLLQNTLWPETQKLYGHGYEVYALAASPDGKYLASACKSTKPEYAAILLWDTVSWKQIQKLMSHNLTVVQLQFSPDSCNLLSVSRDRRWSVFTKNTSGEFELVATTDKHTAVHSRIIWTCSWSHDSKYFATGSRDGKTVVWTRNEGKPKESVLGEYEVASEILEFKNEPVTAVTFAPNFVNRIYIVAIGFEDGIIQLYKWCPEKWEQVFVLSQSLAHHLSVRRLDFRPVFGKAGYEETDENVLQLASCSSDYSVRIYNVLIDTVT